MALAPTSKNTWYTIQNVGNGNYLAAGVLDSESAPVIVTSDQSDSALWQVIDFDTELHISYMRVKALGNQYCMDLNQEDMMRPLPSDSITLNPCGNGSWEISASDRAGVGFSMAQSYLKFISAGPDTSLAIPRRYNETNELVDDSLWTFSSVSAIDDAQFSTVDGVPFITDTGDTVTSTSTTEAATSTDSDDTTVTSTGTAEPGSTNGYQTASEQQYATYYVTTGPGSTSIASQPSMTASYANRPNATRAGITPTSSIPFNTASSSQVAKCGVLSALMFVGLGIQLLF